MAYIYVFVHDLAYIYLACFYLGAGSNYHVIEPYVPELGTTFSPPGWAILVFSILFSFSLLPNSKETEHD